MTNLENQVAEIHARLHERAGKESDLVRTLGAAIRTADHEVLEYVRALTIDHATRREHILSELKSLAELRGLLPRPRTVSADPAVDDILSIEPSTGLSPGDWRQAAALVGKDLCST